MEYRLFIRYTKVTTHQFTLFDSYNKKTDTTDIVESTSSLTRISSAEAQQNTIATAACVGIILLNQRQTVTGYIGTTTCHTRHSLSL